MSHLRARKSALLIALITNYYSSYQKVPRRERVVSLSLALDQSNHDPPPGVPHRNNFGRLLALDSALGRSWLSSLKQEPHGLLGPKNPRVEDAEARTAQVLGELAMGPLAHVRNVPGRAVGDQP